MMHDLSSKNVGEDPVQVPDQLDEFVPLTPVQIFIKEEDPVRDEIGEVVPLTPVQIIIKGEEAVFCKTEEPVLVPLVPVLPKEEDVVDELPDDFEEGTGPLIINLENSSEEWSNHSDPLAIAQNVANASYVEYVESSEPVLMELGATSTTADSLHPLRNAQEATGAVENGELYALMGRSEVVPVSESGGASPDGHTDDECVEIMGATAMAFHCGYCRERFPTEGEMQMHTLSHVGRTAVRREVQEVKLKPKPVRTLRAQHACGDCGETFDRLEYLMRHRLSHLRAVLRKPFSVPKLLAPLKQPGVPQPQPDMSATSDSLCTVAGTSTRTSPKRSKQSGPQHLVTTQEPKRWSRRKKTRRRRVS